jgi:hypothetical protein
MGLGRNAFSEVFMIPLPIAASTVLTWSKIPHSRDYELTRNGEIVGTLRRPSIWSSKSIAAAQDREWIFRRGWSGGTGIEILDSPSERSVATFKSGWTARGVLTLADGQTFHMECEGWWHPVWIVVGQDHQPVLRIHRREKTVELANVSGFSSERLSLLTMFAWYRILQAEEDAAATAFMAAS